MMHAESIVIPSLEWWQALAALLAILGLSPGPWILGLAIGRIQFSAPAERITEKRIADLTTAHAASIAELVRHYAELARSKDDRYAELKESKALTEQARIVEQGRADRLSDALIEAMELGKLNAHLLQSLDEASKDGTQ